ncbi:reverse transcriptase [Tanacetum coccineum]
MFALKNVKYEKNAKEYQDVFDTLLCRVTISQEHAISLYLGGLPTELETSVRMFKPATLVDAYFLTNLQEVILEAVKKKNKPVVTSNVSSFGNGNYYRNTNKPVVLPLPASNSAFKSKPNTPYTPGHKCSGQIFSLVVLDDEDEEGLEKLGCQLKNTCPLAVTIGGGRQLISNSECKGFEWQLQGETFAVDMMILPLGGCEMVLGIQWLSTLGDIKCNFKLLRMEFNYNKRRMVLRDTPKAFVHWIEGNKQDKEVNQMRNAKLLMFYVYPNTGLQLCSLKKEPATKQIVPELEGVIQQYADVFEIPIDVPLKINHDHRIPLKEGTQPINIRPYRHPPTQMDAIKAMVKELLEAGVIKHSTSPFASLIVMHLMAVLEVMRAKQLYAKKSKCVFGTSHVEYLGHVISAEGVSTDPSKIKAMQDWPIPASLKQLRGFLGLTGYYRRFIKNFIGISRPLTTLLKNAFKWNTKAQTSFEHLKLAVIFAPILGLPNFEQPFIVETDASGVGLGAVLQQNGHPISYLSKTLSEKHQALSTYEKEFLVVLMALEKWRGYLLDRHFVIRSL